MNTCVYKRHLEVSSIIDFVQMTSKWNKSRLQQQAAPPPPPPHTYLSEIWKLLTTEVNKQNQVA